MRFLRTANAGGLITLDGVRIAMDGVCGAVAPYLQTPAELREYLQNKVPDAVGFTHLHPDHFHSGSRDFCAQAGTVILMPGTDKVKVGDVKILPIATRHLGKVEPGLVHNSYLISGSQNILFVGDASPSALQAISNVDILIAPYAYANTKAAWELTYSLAEKVVLLHLPERHNDPYNLWQSVETTTAGSAAKLWIPEIGEKIGI